MIMPKLTVSNYPEMLRKLSTATFLVTAASLELLRSHVDYIDGALKDLDIMTPAVPIFGPVKISFGIFLVAFVVACISEAVKLHDKISDLLSIRSEFDLRWILIPMALLSGATLTSGQFEKLRSERGRLMGEVFYAFASSSLGKSVIDGHTITQALTSWSWYWLCVEAIAILMLVAAIFAYSTLFLWVAILLTVSLSLMLVMRVFRRDCAGYAVSQMRQILSDTGRRAAIAAIFNAL